MKGVEELVSQGPEYLGISKAKVVGKTVSSPALGQLGDFFFFFAIRDRNAGEMVQSCLLN